MNTLLKQLKPYPFARLHEAMQGISAPEGMEAVPLHIGEPKHPTPKVITDALTASLHELEKYPLTAGLPELRQACANWLKRRYDGLTVDADNEILPVLGSREALFSFVQTVLNPVSDGIKPAIVSPNPFYQIYEGATLLGGGEIHFANCPAPSFNPDWRSISEEVWKRTKLVFVCSPNNPSGSVLDWTDGKKFLICRTNMVSLLPRTNAIPKSISTATSLWAAWQAAAQLGRSRQKLLMFTSLSKRSNVPGLRSGFVAGDAELLKNFLLYRTYHGSAMSIPVQRASIAAWDDEQHVIDNRRLYQEKLSALFPFATGIDVKLPDASFYIWLKVPDGDDLGICTQFMAKSRYPSIARTLFGTGYRTGQSREGYVRIALVADVATCVKAAEDIVSLYR
ncbi:succinyldiaminopimelate transaminase [Neisseria meningitidis]|uniref:succinyldiaminopimelate transaminase n=1 Tax=Neisseria meningitidis TaxID=487 RepID=UPI000DA0FA78|nr:succinyldiaminopimelate transaminase [Neisseria meningitidis]SPY05613.1 succinyldiaminopimelate transaminase [Neisseria meningitidis]